MNTLFKIFFIILIQISITNGQWINSKIIGGHANVSALGLRNDTVFAVTDGGFYFSTNSDNQWTYLGSNPTDATSLVFNKHNLFAAGGGSGVIISSDNGVNWISADNGLTNYHVSTLVMNDSTLFAGTYMKTGRQGDYIPGGIYSSTDNGKSWKISGLNGFDINILYIKNATIYAGLSKGIYFSSNNGASWDSTNTDLKNIDITAITASATNFFAGDNNGNIYRSTNNGVNWSKVSTLSTTNDYYDFIRSFLVRGNNLYTVNGWGVYLSTDNGSTWSDLNSGLPSPYPYINTSILDDNAVLYVGTMDKGVFTLNYNTATWNLKSIDLTKISQTNTFTNIGNNLYSGTYGDGIFLSKDNGATWYSKNNSPANYPRSLLFSDSHLLAATNDGLFLSNDSSASWIKSNNGSLGPVGVINDNFYAEGGSGELFISTDGGISWNSLSLPGQFSDGIKAFANIGTRLFAGTSDGLYLSTDNNGSSWDSSNSGISNLYGLNINALAVYGNNIFLGAWGVGMYISTNYGSSWNVINNGLTNLFVQCLAINKSDIFVGTSEGGIFHSSNNGSNWETINSGLSQLDVTSLYINGNNIYAGTSAGIFYRPLSEITKVEQSNSILPKQFKLFQNYPNPFNPKTQIDFDITKLSYTTLEIFDILGRRVDLLVSETLKPGHYTKSWNGNGRSSGIYFYSLRSDNNTAIKKMILLK